MYDINVLNRYELELQNQEISVQQQQQRVNKVTKCQ